MQSNPRPRRRSLLALAAVAVLATLVVACNSTPAPSLLSDPTAILTAAATNAGTAKSVHVDAVASGKLPIDLTGAGASAGIDLTGTTASVDADLAGGDLHATFAAPGLLGVRGEVIMVDGSTYLKTTLTGPLYQKQGGTTTTAPTPSVDPATMIKGLQDLLAQPGVDPVKGADVACGSATCYTVEIELTPAELAALTAGGGPIPSGLPIPIPSLDQATIDLTFKVDQATTRLAGLTAVVGLGPDSSATLEATFSKWDEGVTVSAPPPDQIAPSS
jgi:hypothetical protein